MTTPTVPTHTTPIANGRPIQPGEPRTFQISDDLTVTLEIVYVTPELAAEYLTHNTHNRTPKRLAISRFVDDMLSDEWQFTGEPIRFADDGTLLDGQNRLHAIVESEVGTPLLVISGLPMSSQRDIDTGTNRRLHDLLKLAGEPNAENLASLVRAVDGWNAGQRKAIFKGNATHSRALRTLEEHPGLRDLVLPARRVATNCGLTPQIVGLTWWVFQQIDEDDADFFFERLSDGQGLIKGDPIYELRRTVQTHAEKSQTHKNKTWFLAITIKAWNAYRNGETVGLYRYRPGGASPEPFPEPV